MLNMSVVSDTADAKDIDVRKALRNQGMLISQDNRFFLPDNQVFID